MRAVMISGTNEVAVRDVGKPSIGPDEILLKVSGAGLCHSDLAIIGIPFETNSLVAMPLGHEVAGVVEEVGAGVSGWEAGDPGIVSLVLNCGHCRECVAGRDNQCEEAYPRTRTAPLSPGIGSPGGMAEYIAVKAHHLVPLGSLDPTDAAPLADAALTPMHAIASVRERLTADATVAVIGLGGLGHMALQILRATCGATLIALDTDAEKVAFAADHGAEQALVSGPDSAAEVLELTGGRGVNVVLDFVGAQPTVDLATQIIAPGGAIRFVGLGGGAFDYVAGNTALPWGVNIERAYGGTAAELAEVVSLAQRGKIEVTTTHYRLDDAVQAFADLDAGKIQGRIVLVP